MGSNFKYRSEIYVPKLALLKIEIGDVNTAFLVGCISIGSSCLGALFTNIDIGITTRKVPMIEPKS